MTSTFRTFPEPIVIFTGPFGSGKTEVAVNYARTALREGRRVCLVDLDVVTPYFRVGDYRDQLRREGIPVIAPAGALASFELPALPPEIGGAIGAEGVHVVLDVGGDPVGAQLLRVYAHQIAARSYNMWMVANPYRPAAAPEALVAGAKEIEARCELRLTGLVANPNLRDLTQPTLVHRGLEIVREAAARLGLAVILALERRLLAQQQALDIPVLPLVLMVRPPWECEPQEE